MQMGLPQVSACREIQIEAERVLTLSQICGGRMMVESESRDPVAVIAMIPGGYRSEDGHAVDHTKLVELPTPQLDGLSIEVREIIQPETGDVDVSKEEILVAVGRGIQNEDNLEFAQELAEALGGVVCASRPVVDQGWLPASRLVGKSGKRVKPKLYLTLGISGAPEHTEAIVDSEMIVSVDIDPVAPIFDQATYGVEMDMFDLVDELTAKISAYKNG
jgi:electron transfer flavoprotein alpha subunit